MLWEHIFHQSWQCLWKAVPLLLAGLCTYWATAGMGRCALGMLPIKTSQRLFMCVRRLSLKQKGRRARVRVEEWRGGYSQWAKAYFIEGRSWCSLSHLPQQPSACITGLSSLQLWSQVSTRHKRKRIRQQRVTELLEEVSVPTGAEQDCS